MGGAQDSQGSITLWYDNLIFILWVFERERRGNMNYVLAAANRIVPTIVLQKVGDREFKVGCITVVLQGLPNMCASLCRTDSPSYFESVL